MAAPTPRNPNRTMPARDETGRTWPPSKQPTMPTERAKGFPSRKVKLATRDPRSGRRGR